MIRYHPIRSAPLGRAVAKMSVPHRVTRLGIYSGGSEGGMLNQLVPKPHRFVEAASGTGDADEEDEMVDQDDPGGTVDEGVEVADVNDIDLDLRQDSEIVDDVDIGLLLIGSAPVRFELGSEIDQNSEMDQDAEVATETGEPPRAIDVSGQQRPEVDQRIDVDVEVSEDEGVIVVEAEVEVEHDVEIESDLDVDLDDDDETSFEADFDQDGEEDGNVDVDVEIRDDLDADVAMEIASLIDMLSRGGADASDGADGTELDVFLNDGAYADADIGIVVDLGQIDA